MSWPSIDHSLLSPSGHMSKRARKAAMARETAKLFPPGFWDKRPFTAEERVALERENDLRRAKELRELAARGMCQRKFQKEAERLERKWTV